MKIFELLQEHIVKLSSGKYQLRSRKKNPKTGKTRNLGTFDSRAAAEKHEREVEYFKSMNEDNSEFGRIDDNDELDQKMDGPGEGIEADPCPECGSPLTGDGNCRASCGFDRHNWWQE